MQTTLTPRPVGSSIDELLAGATRREPFNTNEVRSGSKFEQVWIDGERLILKIIEVDADFTMRATGDLGTRQVRAYGAGLFDVAPDVIDHAVVGAATGVGRHGWGSALLMRDVSAELVPPGDDPFPVDQHQSFIDHLATMCARTWGWHDDVGLLPYETRWQIIGPAAVACEHALGYPEPVPRIAAEGWTRFFERVPGPLADAIEELQHDSWPLATALRSTPSCFLHGDWKASNLGTAQDGRTVLVDWAYVGEGPACHELGWYLALNRQRLPRTKEEVIEEFRAALEGHGIDTSRWWERQLRLSLLGTILEFGWEKALGDDDELRWWCDRADEGLAWL